MTRTTTSDPNTLNLVRQNNPESKAQRRTTCSERRHNPTAKLPAKSMMTYSRTALAVESRPSVTYGTITQDLYTAKAKVFLRAGMEGEKKYSPPFDTTHCLASSGRLSGVTGFLGSVPVITGFASFD